MLNLLPEPQVARFIRLLPQTWLQGGASCLRAEILACPVSGGQLDKSWVAGCILHCELTLYRELTLYHELTPPQILVVYSLRPLHWHPPAFWISGIIIIRP